MEHALHVVCPHCSSVNRLPAARLQESPSCGRCKQALFIGRPVDLTADSFDRHVEHSDIPVVVDFWAAWCGPCKAMAPAFAQAAQQLEPGFRLAQLDTEAAPQIAGRFGIRSIPTLILFKGGREIARQSGALDAAGLVRWIKSRD